MGVEAQRLGILAMVQVSRYWHGWRLDFDNRGELAHACGRLKPQTRFLPERDRRVAHAPWIACRYRNDEQITVTMFMNDKHGSQLEAAAVGKRRSREKDVALR